MGTVDSDGVLEVSRDRVDRPLSRLSREDGLSESRSLLDSFLVEARRCAAARLPGEREV